MALSKRTKRHFQISLPDKKASKEVIDAIEQGQGDLLKANNLAELIPTVATARSNLAVPAITDVHLQVAFINTSTGAADAGKPVKLDAAGLLNSNMLPPSGVSDHGLLTGLADDDHTQYHNDVRGDARYYTQTQLDGGQLDGQYFQESEFLATSAGAGDVGKPIKLDATGKIDASMLPPSGTGDFLADGSIPMTGNLNLSGNNIVDVNNIGIYDIGNSTSIDFVKLFIGAGGGKFEIKQEVGGTGVPQWIHLSSSSAHPFQLSLPPDGTVVFTPGFSFFQMGSPANGSLYLTEFGSAGLQNAGVGNTMFGTNAGPAASTLAKNNSGFAKDSLIALVDGIGNSAFGKNSGNNVINGDYNICLGFNSTTSGPNVNNEFVVGGSGGQITQAWFGAGGTPTGLMNPVTFQLTPSTNVDAVAGANWTFQAGNKTAGTGNGGKFIIKGGASVGGTPGSVEILADNLLVASFEGGAGRYVRVENAIEVKNQAGVLTNPQAGTLLLKSEADHFYSRTSAGVKTRIPNDDDVQLLDGSNSMVTALLNDQILTPANPAAGKNKLYFKADEALYKLTSAGVETAVGGGVGDFLADGSVPMTGPLVLANNVSQSFDLSAVSAASVSIRGKTSGNSTNFAVESADLDGTDNVALNVFGSGSQFGAVWYQTNNSITFRAGGVNNLFVSHDSNTNKITIPTGNVAIEYGDSNFKGTATFDTGLTTLANIILPGTLNTIGSSLGNISIQANGNIDQIKLFTNGSLELDGTRFRGTNSGISQSLSIGGGQAYTGNNNVLFGHRAGDVISIGAGNTLIGSLCGPNYTSQGSNTGMGLLCLSANTGSSNSAYGQGAGESTGTGSENCYFGRSMGKFNTGNENIGLGCQTSNVNSFTSTLANNEMVVGTTNAAILNSYWGEGGASASPQSFSFNGTQGLGTNINAGPFIDLNGGRGTGLGTGSHIRFRVADAGLTGTTLNPLVTAMEIDDQSNVVVGTGALGTTATDGFLYIPASAGVPTGVPTAQAGRVPIHFDSANNDWYVYNGAWKKVALV